MNNASLELGGTNWAEKDASLLGYTVSDDSGRFFPQEFAFSRGSNLAATRIGKTGLIEKGRENLVLQSNSFDTTWAQNRVDLTSGQSGYDGGSNAWQLQSNDASTTYLQQSVAVSGVQTISLYAKVGTADYLAFYASSGARAWFNLNSGSISSSSSNIDTQIENVGNGWYRCSMSYNASTTYVRIYAADVNANFTSAIGANIYIQDAQLELGLAASPYIPTTTTTAQAGVLENTPRLNYTTGVANPYLLLEPQRTNTYRSSEWIPNLDADLSQEVSDINSPIKNTPFLKITKNTSGLSRQTLYTSTNGDIDTCSVFAKKGSTGGNQIYFADSHYGSSTMNASFDLDTGDWFVTPSGTALVDYGFEDFGNGMYRIWVAGRTMDSANIDPTRWRSPALFLDNGQLSVGEYIYITGLQTERNASYPTSYIPTYSVSATRASDNCNKTGVSDLIGQTEGTMFFEGSVEHTPENVSIMNFDRSTQFSVSFIKATNDKINASVFNGGSQIFNIVSPAISGNFKCALAYKSGDTAFYVNGTQTGVNTTTFTPAAGLDDIYIGSYLSPYFAYDHPVECSQALLFNERLSNADLETLTTI